MSRKKAIQQGIFEDDNFWVDMPEFVQDKQEPYKKLIIRFDCEADYLDFEKKIGQKLTPKTKSIWHPFKSHFRAEKQPVWCSDEE